MADVLDPPSRDAGEVHLDDGLLDACLAPAVALDHRGLESGAAKFGHVELHLARRRDQLALVVARAVGFAVGGALVALGVHELVGLLLEELFDVDAQGLLVYRSD